MALQMLSATKSAALPFNLPRTIIDKDDFGHMILKFKGVHLSGAAEIDRLTEFGEKITNDGRSCFTFPTDPNLDPEMRSYDAKHLLFEGFEYSVALLRTDAIPRNISRTFHSLQMYGMKRYGYGKPIAGLLPRVLEGISSQQMENLELDYICPIHDPILCQEGRENIFISFMRDGRRLTGTQLYRRNESLAPRGGLLFPVQ